MYSSSYYIMKKKRQFNLFYLFIYYLFILDEKFQTSYVTDIKVIKENLGWQEHVAE